MIKTPYPTTVVVVPYAYEHVVMFSDVPVITLYDSTIPVTPEPDEACCNVMCTPALSRAQCVNKDVICKTVNAGTFQLATYTLCHPPQQNVHAQTFRCRLDPVFLTFRVSRVANTSLIVTR